MTIRTTGDFLSGSTRIPVLQPHGAPGSTWPAAGYLELRVRSTGDPAARLRALGASTVVRVEADRVTGGVPEGVWRDISTTDGYTVEAAEGAYETFRLRVVFLARAGVVNVRATARLAVVAARASGV